MLSKGCSSSVLYPGLGSAERLSVPRCVSAALRCGDRDFIQSIMRPSDIGQSQIALLPVCTTCTTAGRHCSRDTPRDTQGQRAAVVAPALLPSTLYLHLQGHQLHINCKSCGGPCVHARIGRMLLPVLGSCEQGGHQQRGIEDLFFSRKICRTWRALSTANWTVMSTPPVFYYMAFGLCINACPHTTRAYSSRPR